jgi:hypothetical protein
MRNRKRVLIPLAIVAVGIALAIKVATQEREPGDFARYYTAGRLVLEGNADRLYDSVDIAGRFNHHFKYLTIFAVLMAPLSALPFGAALWVWKMLHVAAYALGIFFCHRIARADRTGRSFVWMLLPILGTARLFVDNLQLGQINPLVIGLSLTGLWFLSRRRDVAAGLFVALGAAIKFMPILFVILFICRRRWKAVASMLAGLVLFVVIVPSAALGPERNFRLTDRYLSLQSGLVTDPEFDRVSGQSLKAIAFRYLTPMNAVHLVRHNEPIYVNIVDWGPKTAFALYAAASLFLLFAVSLLATRTAEDEEADGRLEALQASAIAVVMLLVSPESRRAHFLLLLLPFTCLTYSVLALRFRGIRVVTAGVLGLLAGAAVGLPSRTLLGRELANLVDAYTNMGFAGIALLAAIYLAARETIARAARSREADSLGPVPPEPPPRDLVPPDESLPQATPPAALPDGNEGPSPPAP